MPAQQLPARPMAPSPAERMGPGTAPDAAPDMGHDRWPLAQRQATETAFEAYIRLLHETNTRPGANAEPPRGRDPWLGLAL